MFSYSPTTSGRSLILFIFGMWLLLMPNLAEAENRTWHNEDVESAVSEYLPEYSQYVLKYVSLFLDRDINEEDPMVQSALSLLETRIQHFAKAIFLGTELSPEQSVDITIYSTQLFLVIGLGICVDVVPDEDIPETFQAILDEFTVNIREQVLQDYPNIEEEGQSFLNATSTIFNSRNRYYIEMFEGLAGLSEPEFLRLANMYEQYIEDWVAFVAFFVSKEANLSDDAAIDLAVNATLPMTDFSFIAFIKLAGEQSWVMHHLKREILDDVFRDARLAVHRQIAAAGIELEDLLQDNLNMQEDDVHFSFNPWWGNGIEGFSISYSAACGEDAASIAVTSFPDGFDPEGFATEWNYTLCEK